MKRPVPDCSLHRTPEINSLALSGMTAARRCFRLEPTEY